MKTGARFPAASIKARALTLERGGRVLVRDFSLTAGPGDAFVLLGPNGAGKTTLLRALAGLVRPEAGTVETSPREGGTAYLAHADALKSGETVARALAFWAALHGGGEASIEPAQRAFAVAHLASRDCARLSAGQRRRAALARILLSDRPIWILDEPAAPLDTKGRALLADAVADHRAAGGVVIAATHADLGWDGESVIDLAAERAA